MTLSNEKVSAFLDKYFVRGWMNIEGKMSYAGKSNKHDPTYAAKSVNNCSGHHNVQMFFLTTDGRVVHSLPGFWSAKYFLEEAKLAVQLAKLYHSNLSIDQRNEKYLDLHLQHAFSHSTHLRNSSKLQGFDYSNITKRKQSDFKREKGFVTGSLKTADQIVHERLAEQPFTPFRKFDVAKFIDMGIKRYKYNYGVPGQYGSGKPKARTKKKRAPRAGVGADD